MNTIDTEIPEDDLFDGSECYTHLCGAFLANFDVKIEYIDGYEEEEVIVCGETLYRKKPIIKQLEPYECQVPYLMDDGVAKFVDGKKYPLRMLHAEGKFKDMTLTVNMDTFLKMYMNLVDTYK